MQDKNAQDENALASSAYLRATMRPMKKLIAFRLVGFAFSMHASAQSACDHPKNDFDGLLP
jgi:hypothetical protein